MLIARLGMLGWRQREVVESAWRSATLRGTVGYVHRWRSQTLFQELTGFVAQLFDVDIPDDAVPAIDLFFDPLEVLSYAMCPPLVAVADMSAALYQPLASRSSHAVEDSQSIFKAASVCNEPVCQEF